LGLLDFSRRRHNMPSRILYITPVTPSQAQGQLRSVYQQIRQELGLVPEPFTLHSPAPILLAGFWRVFRESLLGGMASRGAKEAVAASISELNRCPWCVDAHTMMLYATGNQHTARAILNGRNRSPLPKEMRAIVNWAYATRTPEASALAHFPFPAEQAGEFLGTALAFHYLTRMVSVFLTETFLPRMPWMRAASRRLGGWMLAGMGRRTFATSTLDGASPLPADLHWMAQWPTVAQSFAAWDAVVENLGTQSLPESVRRLVDRTVSAWDGCEPGISRRWVEDALVPLTDAERPIGRVALLAALAPYQMDAATMQTYLELQSDHGFVVSAVAWASWQAVRRIGTWLAPESGAVHN
jgi:AhpD family alkylhydroperoxidase